MSHHRDSCWHCDGHGKCDAVRPSVARQDCDEVPDGYWSRLMALMRELEVVEESYGDDPEMPF